MFESAYETFSTAITILSIFLEFYVLYLIQRVSPKQMNEYKYFLNMYMVFDCLSTVIMGLGLQAQPLSPFLASALRGLCSYVGGNACSYTAVAGIYSGACVLLIQFYCLLYRCCVILPNKNIHRYFMSFWFRCVAWMYGTLTASVMSYLFYETLVAPEQIATHPSIRFNEIKIPLKPDETILLIDADRPITTVCAYATIGNLIVGELLTVVLALLLLGFFHRNSAMFSKTTYRLHLQFTVLINFQVFSPLILIIIPFSLYVFLAFTGYVFYVFCDVIDKRLLNFKKYLNLK